MVLDCSIIKALGGGEKAGRSPADRGKRGIERSVVVDPNGVPLRTVAARAGQPPLLAAFGRDFDAPEVIGVLPEWMKVRLDRGYYMESTREKLRPS